MKRLLLVDGSSYLYRAFHALPDLRNAAGEPTGAVYGVLNMLRRLRSDYKTDYLACVFDAKGPTFRDAWYPAYKAQRPPMPDDLVQQIAPLHAAIRALGWPLLSIPGVEADDVIGTLARQAADANMDVTISTGDKDFAQLVSPQVTLINTMTGETLDPAGVEAKFGVAPRQIVDYLALIGDQVDNVPGVDKVGPKTAVKWLQSYGSLDAIMAAAADFKGATGENLRRALDFLPLGRRLVTIRCDLDSEGALDSDLTALTANPCDREALAALYARLEFKTWARELAVEGEDASSDTAMPPTDPDAHRAGYETILSENALNDWIARLNRAELTAFDTETTSLDPMRARLVGLSFAIAPGEAAYLPLAHHYAGVPEQLAFDRTLAALKPWLTSDQHAKVCQNAKYDMHVLANHGICLGGVREDTMLAAFVAESDKPRDLDQLANRHLGIRAIPYAELCGKGAKQIGFDEVDVERASAYAAEDADLTLQVHRALAPAIAREEGLGRVYRNIEMPVLPVLFAMERQGVLIDASQLAAQSHRLGQRLLELEHEVHALAGQPFNLNSPKQLGEILFDRLGLPARKKTASGAPSTDEGVLSELALDYPLPKLLLEYRSLAKLKGTYTDKLPRMINSATGRVHTHFSQAGAGTGRLASSDPNLQNIPVRTEEGRRIRQAFIAPPGHQFVSADYSQIELRIMAHLSQDAGLLEAFSKGEDVHRATAGEVFGVPAADIGADQRRIAKTINFGLIYGMSAHGLARSLDIDRSEAQTFIDRYFDRYPGVARYMEATRLQAREKGYVETVFGRRLQLPDIRASQPGRRQGAERAAINAPMQGTAADLVKLAMTRVFAWLNESGLQSRLLLQVHDELILEVPDSELGIVKAGLAEHMQTVAALDVPLLVDVGSGANWDEAH